MSRYPALSGKQLLLALQRMAARHKSETPCDRTGLRSLGGQVAMRAWGCQLQRMGFEQIRVRGSHHFLRHSDGRKTVVPVHSGEMIGPGLLNSILRQVQISRDELFEQL